VIKKKVKRWTDLSSNVYIGLDPGLKGGLVALQNKEVISYQTMPETKLDLWEWFKSLGKYKNRIAVLEKVNSYKQGRKSAFTFGGQFHVLEAFCIASETTCIQVSPLVWQRQLQIPKKGKTESDSQFKTRLLKHSQRLYPSLEIWKQPKSKGKQLAICDALLMATYCKLTLEKFN
jgi:hypothetical protein